MASKSNFTGRAIPSLSTRKSAPFTTNFAKGMSTYKPNDTMASDELRLAMNARFDRVGEYKTRRGSNPISELIDATALNTPATAEQKAGNLVTPFTATGIDGRLSGFTVKLGRATDNYVTPKLTVTIVDSPWNVNPGDITPQVFCIDNDQLTDTLQDFNILDILAPGIGTACTVKIELGVQDGSLSDLIVGVDEGTTTLNATLYGNGTGTIVNIFEANINGAIYTLVATQNKLYSVRPDGSVQSIRNLPSVSKVRFCQLLDEIRYADGKEPPHKLVLAGGNFADSAITVKDLKTDTAFTFKPSNIMAGPADNVIYFDADVNTRAVWTYPYGYTWAKSPAFSTTATINGNPGATLSINKTTITPSGIAVGDWITGQGTATAEVTSISGNTVNLKIVDTTPQTISTYDAFNLDFYQNFPAIKTGDPITAMFNLGGVIYIQTRRAKYQMYMQSAEAWTQSACNAQGGTFSQESVACDQNYAYYANDKGIYAFDGSSEWSLTEKTIQNLYDAIPGKQSIVVALYKNRLYVFYSSIGNGQNDRCLVYNTNLGVWESVDTNVFIGAVCTKTASSRFLAAPSRGSFCLLQLEDETCPYADAGVMPIDFDLETNYQPFGTTSQLKRITKWRPEFGSTDQPYSIKCGYAMDFTDNVKYAFSINLQNQQVIDENYIWDNPPDFGVPTEPTVHTTLPQVNGEFYRCQLRYQHHAAFQPVVFRSHTLTIQTQRIR